MKHNWEYKKLGEICDIYQPKTISTTMLVENGKYPVYGANGIIGKYDKYNHQEKELLMTCRGATCGSINVSQPYSWINGNAMVIHPLHDNIVFDFLKYQLMTLNLSCIVTGAAQPQITRQSLTPILIPLPPLSVQERIVEELDGLSLILEKKKQQIKELDSLAQSIFYDMFGDPIENEKGWEVRQLKNIAALKNGLNYDKVNKGYNVKILSVSDFQNNKVISSTDISYTIVSKEIDENFYLRDNDLIFVRSNGSKSLIGRCVLINTLGEAISFSGFCIRCRITSDCIIPQYVLSFMQNTKIREQLTGGGRGCNIQNINQQNLGNQLILLPPLDLQQSFAKKIEAIEKQKELINQSIKEVQLLFDAKMDYYFGD